jgi:hypothetical protein
MKMWTQRRASARSNPGALPTESMSLAFQRVNLNAPPSGIGVPDLDSCEVQYHDYGNGNVQAVYTCVQFASNGTRYRCTWTQWNSDALHYQGCVELAPLPFYHHSHGSEGPQSYGTPATPPYLPSRGQSMTYAAAKAMRSVRNPLPVTQHIREAVHRLNPGPYTPVCPPGEEPCGQTTSGGIICCDIPIKGPTPAGTSAPAADEPFTSVCPAGQEVCGDPLPGHDPPCCPKPTSKWGARFRAQQVQMGFFHRPVRGVSRIHNLGRRASGAGCGGSC